ncbi:EcsC protein family protein [Tsuneonella dongtanensis]|uniref:EcsC protein family protein n=1 Tax=Tsuneonella dongtanensis TaxID=692370 RepID=A0A1B2AE25_9SPHN|nr:EcsC family protein [Tsuneonella dongtanensis]ANY20348.1 EcsC protein family protein [Tsuneonella dongtanensis]
MDIRKEQAAYRNAKPSRLGRGIERLTNPFGKAIASVVPNSVVESVVKGIDAAAGAPSLAAMRHDPADLDAAREAARKIERLAKNVNGATGAAAGFGGAISAGLDIPASLGIALRSIRDTGRAYGFDGKGEAEKLFRLQILELAALDDPELRAQRIAGIEQAIAEDGSLKPVTGDAATPMVDAAIERISRAMAFATFRRRLGMVVPIAGSAVGLLVNRSFQEDVAKAARFAFQERRLKTMP